ncbi:MAG: tetratricopeptide repeat protein [Pseudomonadota bacterium]|nr:tetratricopeptide repeat protein [Pseudomonadota bacterium]
MLGLWLQLLIGAAWATGGLVEPGEIDLTGTADEAVSAARAALDARRFDEAASAYAAIADAGGGVSARVAQAVALYENGELRAARAAAEKAIEADAKSVAALNVLGLALVDSGAVEAGIAKLEAAKALASGPWKARILVNLGLALLDRGSGEAARSLLTEAKALTGGDARLDSAIADALAAVSGLTGKDQGVGPMLGRGDLKGARAQAEKATGGAATRRDRVLAGIQLAAVERAEGNLDASVKRLEQAVREAREAGMAREVAVAMGNLGLAQTLAGRHPLAADALRSGAAQARDGGYRVVEVDLRCELGLALVNQGLVDDAETEQRAAGALLATMDYPQGVARQAELGGRIAALRGDSSTAVKALSQAVSWHEGLGRWMDAARVATALAGALQQSDAAQAQKWGARAEGLFVKAGDSLGPAHVAMARALADARAKRLEPALAGFARAAEAAEKVGGGRGNAVARIARENAAQTLVMLGQSEDVARLAAQAGVADLLQRQVELKAAFADYDAGLAAYDGGGWADARTRFQAARQAFDKLGEPGYAMRSRRAAAWSVYNQTVALPTVKAYPAWTQLVEETAKLEDPELFARTYAAAALGAHALKQGDPSDRLVECSRLAEAANLKDVNARCHGALAEREGDLDARAKHARAAYVLAAADTATVYALYVVAVDAYNAGRNQLALELGGLARPNAGSLAVSLDEVLAAAKQEQ